MRITSGRARGTELKTPEGMLTRPTTDKVKQAIFNIIQFDIAGNVLDLFAGTGQLGLEALSRGATHAVFVDEREAALKVVRENIRRTHFESECVCVRSDYMSYLERCREKYKLIFLDPPYAEEFLENAIKKLSQIDILDEGAIIITERPVGKQLDFDVPGMVRSKDYVYGKTVITLFRREQEIQV